MIGKVFGALTLFALIFGACSGRLDQVAAASVSGAEQATALSLSLIGMMSLWSGMVGVLDELGFTRALTRLFAPLMRLVFPGAARRGGKEGKGGMREIAAAFSANLLGIGNAATPLAVRAMQTLAQNDGVGDEASDDMVTFTVLGCSCPTLFPTTLIALRSAAGSADPFAILPAVWVCSVLCSVGAVILARLLRHLFPLRRKKP